MNYIIFGGSGFIGTHLIHLLKSECVKSGDKIYDLDIVMPGEEGVVPGIVEKNDGVKYIRLDVRKPIEFDFEPTKDDVILILLRYTGLRDTLIMHTLKPIFMVQRM